MGVVNMPNRYDIRFIQESENELRIWINDKLRQYATLRGITTTTVTAELANSFKNDLTDAMRHISPEWEDIPALVERWLQFLEKNNQKEFTDGSTM
jgi:Fic family protein